VQNPKTLEDAVAGEAQTIEQLLNEVRKVVVGQERMLEALLLGLLTNGHVLLEGVPGLAKTLTVSSLAKALSLSYNRIQFTPDLLPSDVVGTLIYNPKNAAFETRKGPVFANLVLADEINRSPAKVQSALLEAMQERQVSLGDHSFDLPNPFLVLATQNPIDQEGTYPLPEAQVDRFMMKVSVGYPSREEELQIMRRMASTERGQVIEPVLSREAILQMRQMVDHIRLEERLEEYIVALVWATRHPGEHGLNHLAQYIQFGASPRASIAMNLTARARAFLKGRSYVLPEDVKAVAPDILNHRLIRTFEAEADEITSRHMLEEILAKVPI
jgi:MoxR-like ATPase